MDLGTATSAGSSHMVDLEIPRLIRTSKCGHVQRFRPDNFVPPSVDRTTGVSSKDVAFSPGLGLSARLYLPPLAVTSPLPEPPRRLPLLMYFHGGAFCTGSPFSSIYHRYLNSLVSKAGVVAVSIDYRLAPEHPLPAAYDDSWEALRWAAGGGHAPPMDPWLTKSADLGRIFLAGDSAGANIAHEMGMRLGEEGKKVEGLMLVHPFFWGRERIGSEEEDREGMWFGAENVDDLCRLVFSGTAKGLDDPRLNPMAMGGSGLAGLGCRRVLVSVAGKDFVRERGRAYYEKLVASGWGGEAQLVVSQGKDHIFHLIQRRSEEAVELMRRLVRFIGAPKTNGHDALATHFNASQSELKRNDTHAGMNLYI